MQEVVGDVWGPDARVWDWLLKVYASEFQEAATDTGAKFTYDQAITALQTARATQSWLDRRLDFNDKPKRGEIEPKSQFLWFLSKQVEASEDMYAPFLKFNFAKDLRVPKEDETYWLREQSLLWIGGTYACDPQHFPPEQTTPQWLREFLCPLRLQPPGWLFAWGRKFHERWCSARWHGKPPHSAAMDKTFPCALESMKDMVPSGMFPKDAWTRRQKSSAAQPVEYTTELDGTDNY